MLGRRVLHYRITEKLGAGGMGEVYAADDTRLERKVALKVLPADWGSDPERLRRFEREAKAVAALNHPNIVTVYSVEEADGLHFFTMELVEGEPLDRASPPGGLPLDQLLDLAIALADALAEAHEQGIVHRDLKPANILVDRRGRPKILDFGLARWRKPLPEAEQSQLPTEVMTREGTLLGTYPYMSPEQAEGGSLDHRSDIFSLGIVLYEMATGRRPFSGKTPMSLISSILRDQPRSVRDLRGELPERFGEIVGRCLEKDPQRRLQSAAELRDLLEELRRAPLPADAGEPAAETVFEVTAPSFLAVEEIEEAPAPVFVGRETELARLEGLLQSALDKEGRVAFVTGEAGTGKTALVRVFAQRAQQARQELVVAFGGCSPHTGPGDAYAPFRQILELLTGDVEAECRVGALTRQQAERLWSLLPEATRAISELSRDLVETLIPGPALVARAKSAGMPRAPWFGSLRELVERKRSLPPDVMLQQSAVFGQYGRLLQALSESRPLLLVLEDLHWVDTGSADLLGHLARQVPGHRLLIFSTYRPSEIALGRGGDPHPLASVVDELQRRAGECTVNLDQAADRQFVEELIDSEPNRLGSDFRAALCDRTAGHALFTVELLRGMQEQGMLVLDESGCWVEGSGLDWEVLPAQVEGAIRGRIARLSERLRELLTVASVEGENFTAEVLASVQKADTRDTVRLLGRELERRHRLIAAQGLERVNGSRLSLYRFLHVLFQRYVYGGLDEAERAYLHEAVGNALEELYGDRRDEIASQLARHFREAGAVGKSVPYLEKAGRRAAGMTANREAIEHYRSALELLGELPAGSERDTTELRLRIAMGAPLATARGWGAPEVGRVIQPALELAERAGSDPRALPAHWFLTAYEAERQGLQQAGARSLKMIEIAEKAQDETQIAMAHWLAGVYRGLCGELAEGRAHLEKTENFYDPERHAALAHLYGLDPGAAVKAHLGWLLCYLGYLRQARDKGRQSIALARQVGHPYSLHFSCFMATVSDWLRRDWTALREHNTEAARVAEEHGFTSGSISVWMQYNEGLLLAKEGKLESGIEQIEESVARMEAGGWRLNVARPIAVLADCYRRAGSADAAHRAIARALAVALAEETGEFKQLAALRRIEGEVLVDEGKLGAAEESFLEAIDQSRRFEARLLELEAATCLASLWARQGRCAEARELLAPIYGWFTEGLDEAPLRRARAVLEGLS